MKYPISKNKKLGESEETKARLRGAYGGVGQSEEMKVRQLFDKGIEGQSEEMKARQMMDKGIESKSEEYKPEIEIKGGKYSPSIEIESPEYKPGLNRKPDSLSIEVKGMLSGAKKSPKMEDMEEGKKMRLQGGDKKMYEEAMASESKYLETLRKRKAK